MKYSQQLEIMITCTHFVMHDNPNVGSLPLLLMKLAGDIFVCVTVCSHLEHVNIITLKQPWFKKPWSRTRIVCSNTEGNYSMGEICSWACMALPLLHAACSLAVSVCYGVGPVQTFMVWLFTVYRDLWSSPDVVGTWQSKNLCRGWREFESYLWCGCGPFKLGPEQLDLLINQLCIPPQFCILYILLKIFTLFTHFLCTKLH